MCFIIIALRIIGDAMEKNEISLYKLFNNNLMMNFERFNSNQNKEFVNSFNGKIGISKMFLEMFKVGTKDKKKYVI